MAVTSDNAAFSPRAEGLAWLRDLLAAHLDDSDGRTSPALAREYRAVLAEIEALPTAEAKSRLDELRARRESKSA
jgi:hypothetical protein